MSYLITVTEAARSFADIIGRVYYRGEEFDIKKGGQVVAHLGPSKNRSTLKAAELNYFFAEGPKLSEEDVEAFEKELSLIRASGGEFKNPWD